MVLDISLSIAFSIAWLIVAAIYALGNGKTTADGVYLFARSGWRIEQSFSHGLRPLAIGRHSKLIAETTTVPTLRKIVDG